MSRPVRPRPKNAPRRRRAPSKSRNGRFEVVAIGASAGGFAAIATILRGLRPNFPLPIVATMHLGPASIDTAERLARLVPFETDWARPGARLEAGRVLLCPPRSTLELLPDGTCATTAFDGPALVEKPIDRFFESVARSFGERAVGLILSGMADDGAAGARKLQLADGCVLVQSEATADQSSMPRAAIRSGAANVVLPLERIAAMLDDLAAGRPAPRRPSEKDAVAAVFPGDGAASRSMRGVDWSRTPLGPVADWGPELRIAARSVMSSKLPTALYWGRELVLLYNDAVLPYLGKEPDPGGRPARLIWPALWGASAVQLESVRSGEGAVCWIDQPLSTEMEGEPQESFLTMSYSPLYDGEGAIGGVLAVAHETTARVLGMRRLRTLNELAAVAADESPQRVIQASADVLAGAPFDVPFALLYLIEDGRRRANLGAAVGLAAGSSAAPDSMSMFDDRAVWPIREVLRNGTPVTVDDAAARLAGTPCGPWPEGVRSAALLPLQIAANGEIAGVAVLGLSPRLRQDSTYADFIASIGRHIGKTLGESRARQQERERGRTLAELDRARNEFFANVSHEFRTPLALLIAPLEDMLLQRDALPPEVVQDLEVATRNARRLLGLVTNLLDFSQMESRTRPARLEPANLAAVTSEVAGAFRSAIERAGLQFRVECTESLPLVPLDREMWHRVLSNLLSNAFKFTFEGEISVVVQPLSLHAEVVVSDTGIGIPEDEVPNVFKRFHRVPGARGRTAEGSGIGLSIVHDLVARMGGQLRVMSRLGRGTQFTIWLPYKSVRASKPAEHAAESTPLVDAAAALADEASRWSAESGREPDGVVEDLVGPPAAAGDARSGAKGRIVVADDNADMRAYLRNLLSPRWDVEVASDGAEALELARRVDPDLLLVDVMMPRLDGFELLERIRNDAQLRHTPVVIVTARAGEEATIAGLLARANDYVSKPFSPRELVARIDAVVARARTEAALRSNEAWLSGQKEAFQAAAYGAPLEVSLDVLGKTAIEQLGADRCAFYVADETGTSLRHVTGMSAAYAESVAGFKIGLDSLACGLAVATNQPVLTADVAEEPRWKPWLRLAEQHDFRGCWSFPIEASSGKVVGAIAMYFQKPREASERDREAAAVLTRAAAIIISKSQEAEERVRAQEALRASEEKYRALSERLRRAAGFESVGIFTLEATEEEPPPDSPSRRSREEAGSGSPRASTARKRDPAKTSGPD